MLIKPAEKKDLKKILNLQYLAYESEAALLNNWDIPPLKQTLKEVNQEFENGIILKAILDTDEIVGSVRGKISAETLYIGKLIVAPQHQHNGIGTALLREIIKVFPTKRYELFTSAKSIKNIQFYEKSGFSKYKTIEVTPQLSFVYLEKISV